MNDVKTVPVQEPVLRGFEGAIKALNKRVEDAIHAIDSEKEVAPVFDRSDPIESASSLLKTVDQNVGLLAGMAKTELEKAEKAGGIAERMAKALEHNAKGDKPCASCKTTGRDGKAACSDCGGEGFVEAKKPAA